MICAKNISKSYQGRVLFSSLSFSHGNGILLLRGRSGCGKSTLMSILMGKVKPDSGTIRYDKQTPVFSYCGTEASLFSSLSLNQNLKELGIEVDGERRKELSEILSFHYDDQRLSSLSGGERQKAELCAALSREADIYFLDEPFSSLDQDSKNRLAVYLQRFSKEHSIVLIHHGTEVDGIEADKTILFEDGKTEILGNQDSATLSFMNPMKKNRILPFLHHYRKTQLAYGIIKGVIGALAMVFLAMGASLTQTEPLADRNIRLLQEDPFQAHTMNLSEVYQQDNGLFEDIQKKGIPCLEMISSGFSSYVYGCLEEGNQTLLHYSKNGDGPFSGISQVDINSKQYSLSLIDKTALKVKLPFETKTLKSVLDDYVSMDLILASPSVVDEILLSGADSLTDGTQSLGFFGYSDFYLNSNNVLSDSDSKVSTVEITAEEGYSFEIKGLSTEKTVYDQQKHGYSVKGYDGPKEVRLSLSAYKQYLMRTKPKILSYDVQDDYLISLMKSSNGAISARNALSDYSPKRQGVVWLSFGVLFLCSEIFFVLFSEKGKDKWITSLHSVYQNQQFSTSSFRIGALLSSVIEQLPGLLLSFLLYFLWFIPRTNYSWMMDRYGACCPEGYYYYSEQPMNPYYDNIRAPLKLMTPQVFVLIVVAAFFILALFGYLGLTKRRKNKNR